MKSTIVWIVILGACLYWLHYKKEAKHQLAFEAVRSVADIEPASLDIERAFSACTNYLGTYPNRKERADVERWISAIQQEEVLRAEEARLATNMRLRKKEERERLEREAKEDQERIRIANLPENLFKKAQTLAYSNNPEAIPLLQKASDKGYADASFEMGKIYAKGLCGQQVNKKKGLECLSKAASQGHSGAKTMLRRREQQRQAALAQQQYEEPPEVNPLTMRPTFVKTTVFCPSCGGKSYYGASSGRFRDRRNCSTCRGTGKVTKEVATYPTPVPQRRMASLENSDLSKCRICGGTGSVYESNIDGVFVPFRHPRKDLGYRGPVTCSECNGTGRPPFDYCPRCEGNKTVLMNSWISGGKSTSLYGDCPLCNGTGRRQ